jgi:hypothetical protein
MKIENPSFYSLDDMWTDDKAVIDARNEIWFKGPVTSGDVFYGMPYAGTCGQLSNVGDMLWGLMSK